MSLGLIVASQFLPSIFGPRYSMYCIWYHMSQLVSMCILNLLPSLVQDSGLEGRGR